MPAYDEARPLYNYVYDAERQLNNSNGEKQLKAGLYNNIDLMQLYRLDVGLEKIKPVEIEHREVLSDTDVEQFDYLINHFSSASFSDFHEEMKAHPLRLVPYVRENVKKLERLNRDMYTELYNFSDEEIDNILREKRAGDYAKQLRAYSNILTMAEKP